MVAAFVLFAWALDKNGMGNTYYAAAAKSGTMSWRNLWYGSFDPGGWITTDKPPLALWLTRTLGPRLRIHVVVAALPIRTLWRRRSRAARGHRPTRRR